LAAARWRSVFLGSAGVFAALALVVYFRGSLPGETVVYDAVLAWASPGVVTIFWWINWLGNKWVLIPATLLLLWAGPPDARRRWWLWAGVMIIAPILEWLGKELIGRPRPEGKSFGFPSGHATAASAYFFLAAHLVGKRLERPGARVVLLWIMAAALVVLAGLARIVLQAHWPGDALAGAVLGLMCVSLAAWYHER
jgi:undecaprenyl-diphosphatase